jgi:hypothetical protein
MATLMELTQRTEAIQKILEAGIAVETPEQETALDKLIQDELETRSQLDAKIDGYCTLIREVDLTTTARKDESKRLGALAQVGERLSKRLKANLQTAMERLGIRALETARFKLWFQRNGGKPPMELDEFCIPREYMKVELKPDLEKIREALNQGQELPFARLLEPEEGLRLK